MRYRIVAALLVVNAILGLGWYWRARVSAASMHPRALSAREFDDLVMERVVGGTDRRVSQRAFLAMGGKGADFVLYDANHDGFLDAGEFAHAMVVEEPGVDVPHPTHR